MPSRWLSNKLLVLLAVVIGCTSGLVQYEPQQIHIATGSSDAMTVVWNTVNPTNESTVLYGKGRTNLTMLAGGRSTKFVDGGPLHNTQYVHEVKLGSLEPETVYFYMVGSVKYGLSDVLTLKTWPAGDTWSPSLAIYGDLGNVNAQSLPRLQYEAAQGMYDAILHVGDFAYNMASDNGEVGNAFMRQIEPLASSIPYLTCPGNHESAYNFSNYKNRFRMPGDTDQRMYYSFKMGPVRFISTSTEYVFFPSLGLYPIFKHFDWLKKELEDANLPENRAKQPWVITYGHRPMYCSNSDHDDCTSNESIIRTGIDGYLAWEKLFYENGVDIALWAHEHSYERLWPLYNREVRNGSYDHPYTNPPAPVHIITGSAGCYSKHDPFNNTMPYWSAFRTEDYGYTRMKVFNSTHVSMEQVSDDKGGAVVDKVMVIKNTHGSYPYDPKPIKPVQESEMYRKLQHLIKTGGKDLP